MCYLRVFVLSVMGIFGALSFDVGFENSYAAGIGKAISFDGSNTLETQWSATSNSSFTFECWVFPTSSGTPCYLIYAGDTTSGFGFAVETNGLPKTYATINVGGQTEPVTGNSTRLPLRTWTHLAIVKDSNLWLFYRNGMLVGRRHYLPDSISSNLFIGHNFVGLLSEIKIWSRPLSDSEIRTQIYSEVPPPRPNLEGYWCTTIDSTQSYSQLPNHGNGLPSLTCINSSGRINIVGADLPLVALERPIIRLTDFPAHQQFFSRDASGFSTVLVRGTLETPGFDSIVFETWRNDTLMRSLALAPALVGGIAPFSFSSPIHAELSQYTVRLLVKKEDLVLPVAEGADLVSGDAYFINGQSNAHSSVFGYTWRNPFARSFGIQTPNWNLEPYDPADTSWGLANADGWGEWFSGPYFTGAWGLRIQEHIVETYGIPVCIINGAAGGTDIMAHYRNDSDKYDLTTVYGRALYRLKQSSLLTHLRAIFWYQGEYDFGLGYYGRFLKLYHQWNEDIPYADTAVAKRTLYIFQVRPGCTGGDAGVREAQRLLPDSIDATTLIATSAIYGFWGCHYGWNGYFEIGDRTSAVVSRDYYGCSDSVLLDPPNVAAVRYGDSLHRTLRVTFRQPDPGLRVTQDSIYEGRYRRIEDAFLLDGETGRVDSVRATNGELLLFLHGPGQSHTLTYVPDRYYPNDTIVFEGPWIVNGRGIGALTFDSIPIGDYVPDTESAGTAPGGGENFQCQLRFLLGRPTLLIHSVHALSASLLIVDEIGRTISSIPLAIVVGDSGIPLDLDPLPAGPLFVRVGGAGQTITFRFVNP